MRAFSRKIIGFAALAMIATVVSGCADEEQDRILQYKKGSYLGKADQGLTEAQLRELAVRANGQRVY